MSKNTFLPEDLSGNIYIQASALQKCAKHLPPTFGGMIAMQSGRCPNMSKIVAGRRARFFMLLYPCYTLAATLEHIQKGGT